MCICHPAHTHFSLPFSLPPYSNPRSQQPGEADRNGVGLGRGGGPISAGMFALPPSLPPSLPPFFPSYFPLPFRFSIVFSESKSDELRKRRGGSTYPFTQKLLLSHPPTHLPLPPSLPPFLLGMGGGGMAGMMGGGRRGGGGGMPRGVKAFKGRGGA